MKLEFANTAAQVISEQLNTIDNDFPRESSSMRAVGISRGDAFCLLDIFVDEFSSDLSKGGPDQAIALFSIIEICLQIGVRLERARWTGMNE
jgi:hypothetical protein